MWMYKLIDGWSWIPGYRGGHVALDVSGTTTPSHPLLDTIECWPHVWVSSHRLLAGSPSPAHPAQLTRSLAKYFFSFPHDTLFGWQKYNNLHLNSILLGNIQKCIYVLIAVWVRVKVCITASHTKSSQFTLRLFNDVYEWGAWWRLRGTTGLLSTTQPPTRTRCWRCSCA